MVVESLQVAKDELAVLRGKQIELHSKKEILDNTKKVFLEELKRIEGELSICHNKLRIVDKDFNAARWRVLKLRLKKYFRLTCECMHYVYIFLSFVLISLLNVVHATLMLAAYFVQTLLESQETNNNNKGSESNRSLKVTSCWT